MRYFERAWRLCFQSTYSRKKNKRMAAVIVKGGCIVSSGPNCDGKHAESRAIRPHNNYQGATIYIARANRGISKPCANCLDKIILSGIKSMVYVNREGNLVKEFIRSRP